jgi:predicted DNA-binding transcriptional regulator AlpA
MDTNMHPGVTVDPDGETWWNTTAVASALCCSKRTARRWSRTASFPPAFEFSPRVVRWRASEVRAWRDARRRTSTLTTAGTWQPAGQHTEPAKSAPNRRGRGVVGPRPKGTN